jgi:hypothetical protein
LKPQVYLETSFVSYLVATPSSDVVLAGRQQVSRDWWEQQKHLFDLRISEFVLREAEAGDPEVAARRLRVLKGIPEIAIEPEMLSLAQSMISTGPLPQIARVDAAHLAVAVVGGVDYIMTWNFKHMANAVVRQKIERFCRASGYEPPVICTPEELVEGLNS